MADVSCDRGAIPESCCTKGLKRKAQVVDEFVRCDQLGCASRRPTIQSRKEGVLRSTPSNVLSFQDRSKEQLWSWACPDEVVNVVVLFVVDEDAAEVVAVSNMADAAMDAVAVVTDEAIDVIVSVVSVAAEDDVDDGTADC
ncbi:hypothetical protein PF011_g27162 [Phytophthora fragariae]|uniref:Uncharacterized protein n=1 Tax=Phytophthora fragariae TaxID=53985 RepID=A0A6A3HGZ4_9STRA|nr:hypothetical protein PF011_g27162 [Phytophthora fragariae]KAE9276631.1 hypothetical protein PF008_g29056 [Phytophthora fragariae]